MNEKSASDVSSLRVVIAPESSIHLVVRRKGLPGRGHAVDPSSGVGWASIRLAETRGFPSTAFGFGRGLKKQMQKAGAERCQHSERYIA